MSQWVWFDPRTVSATLGMVLCVEAIAVPRSGGKRMFILAAAPSPCPSAQRGIINFPASPRHGALPLHRRHPSPEMLVQTLQQAGDSLLNSH